MDREPLLDDGEWSRARRRETDAYVLTAYEYPKGDGYRRERERYYMEERWERRHSSSAFAKLLLVCIVCITFLLLMYIPVYNKVNTTMATVSGWAIDANRDTKIYVQPGNITLIHDVENVCPELSDDTEPLFLLVIVCSSTVNFKERRVIRNTWGSYDVFLAMSESRKAAKEMYKDYKFDYDLVIDEDNSTDGAPSKDGKRQKGVSEILHRERKGFYDLGENHTNAKFVLEKDANLVRNVQVVRRKRNIVDFLPEIAAALNKHRNAVAKETQSTEEVRFEDASDQNIFPEFEMDKVLGDEKSLEADYEEESNVMKIPPRGYDDSPDLDKVMSLLRAKLFANATGGESEDNKLVRNKLNVVKPVFKVLFLLGLPTGERSNELQDLIEQESKTYGDVIQESFIDSYNNLTLKSIMMLKWLTTHCDRRVRYILKSDDDVFLNVPKLVSTLEERYEKFLNSQGLFSGDKEYYIMGTLIRNARPVTDTQSKWYSPHYMYPGRIYPRYLSGASYVMTNAAVPQLYEAALRTQLFHFEDVFITGMCAARSVPRLHPQAEESFSHVGTLNPSADADGACVTYTKSAVHRFPTTLMYDTVRALSNNTSVARCERIVLQKKRMRQLQNAKVMSHSRISKSRLPLFH